MKFKLNLKGLNIEIEDEAENPLELIRKTSFFTSLPDKCENCEKEDLVFSYRKTEEGYEYPSLKCMDCGYELKFGQSKKNPGELFAKDWEPPYQVEEEEEEVEEKKSKTKKTLKKKVVEEETVEEEIEEAEEEEVEEETPKTTLKKKLKKKKAAVVEEPEEEIEEEVEEKKPSGEENYRDVLARIRAKKNKGKK